MRCLGRCGWALLASRLSRHEDPQAPNARKARLAGRPCISQPARPVLRMASAAPCRTHGPQWLQVARRWAQPVVCFSMKLKSSYITIAIAPTTTRPAKARPICMAEPAEMSR